MERCLNKLSKALSSLDPPLRVAQTRLKKRVNRPEVENCADEVYHHLVEEVKLLNNHIKLLQNKNDEAKEAFRNLTKSIEILEKDLKLKKNSLLIDQQKCMALRKTFPYLVVSTCLS